MSDAARRVP